MKRNINLYKSYIMLYAILIVLLLVNTVICAFVNIPLMLVSVVITIAALILVLHRVLNIRASYKAFIKALESGASMKSKALSEFNTPVIFASGNNEIIWYNRKFESYLKNSECYGMNIVNELGINEEELSKKGSCSIAYKSREFSVYQTIVSENDYEFKIFYLIDDTFLKRSAREYSLTRPVVMIITLDNFNEVMRNSRDSEKSSFRSAIHIEIENWLSDVPCITLNMNDNTMFVVLEERNLTGFIENKFSVLDSVRKLKIGNIGGVTLSVGIGRGGKTMAECEAICRQALEMAQSRGGDQVAIKNRGNEYKFFGGISKSVERRTKVKARVIASSIQEMINASSKVVFMGHKYSDLDCLGAAYALSTVAAQLNKKTYIVIDPQKTLALPLYKRIISEDRACIFTSGNDLDTVIDDRTLLIVLDAHRSTFLENSEVYGKIKNIIVVDHHRKAVDAISNAVIFYHETAASSTCEMVTELLQYMDDVRINPLSADALLSGIMLDTKNFCLHTGVRTFEAAAYLRSCGSDPVLVKKLFSDNMRTYSRKTAIVSSAQLYEDCAISYDDTSDDVTRISTSQAADEMLDLENVNASFVMCRIGDEINISARSLGEINVQLIMEALGGGGHQNMAACQLKTDNFATAKKELLDAIKSYKQNY